MSNVELELPLAHRKAVAHLRPKYHVLEVLFYDPVAKHTVIRTQAREESEERETILHEHDGEMYKKDADAWATPGFPVFREKSKQTGPLHVKRANRRRRPVEDSVDLVQASGTTMIWMDRRAIERELETMNYTFIREPTLANMQLITKLRVELNTIDQRLAIMSEAAQIIGEDLDV